MGTRVTQMWLWKLYHLTLHLGSQVLCGEDDARDSVPSYGTVHAPPSLEAAIPVWPCDLLTFFFFSCKIFFFWWPLDFCAFNKYTLVIENKMRSNDQVRNLWNEECLKQPSRFLKLCLQGSHGKMPALTYFLFTACFPAPSTLIHTQFFSWNCSTFAADICSSSCE